MKTTKMVEAPMMQQGISIYMFQNLIYEMVK